MKSKIIFFILLIVLFFCFPQKIHSQTIQLLSENSEVIPYANAFINNTGTKNIYQAQSNEAGLLTLTIPINDTANYLIRLTSIGFLPYKKNINGHDLINLKTITLIADKINLNEVVVTGQYKRTLAEKSIHKVKIIDAKKIESIGAINLRDVLASETNIRLAEDNILGSSMSIQGVSGENVKILIDGIPVIGRLNGNVDLSQINLTNIEQIEIIEGPLSVQYGTNALAGTINLITKKSAKNKVNETLNSHYESIGTYNFSFSTNTLIKKSTINLSAGRNYFDGWNNGDKLFNYAKTQLADSTRYNQWKPKEHYFGNMAYNQQFKHIHIGYKLACFNEIITNKGLPRLPYNETAFDDYYYTKRVDNAIILTGKILNRWNLNASTAYNYYQREKHTYYKDLTTLAEILTNNPSDQDTSTCKLLTTRATFSRTKENSVLNYEIGYDINYEWIRGRKIEGFKQQTGDYALFATAEYRPLKLLVFKPGLRYSYNTTYNSPIIPSLNIKWDVNNSNTLRASYARGFRAPTLKELYFNFVDINHNIVGNKNLKQEHSNNYSITYSTKKIINSIILTTEFTAFHNTIFNLITLAKINKEQYGFVNIGNYKSKGISANTELKTRNFKLTIGGCYTGRYNKLSVTEKIKTFSYSPEMYASINYLFPKNKTNISAYYKYNGKLPGFTLTNNTLTQTYVDDYALLDISVGKLFWKERISILLGAKNILNITNISANASESVHSSTSSTIPLSTGRNYFFKLILKLWH